MVGVHGNGLTVSDALFSPRLVLGSLSMKSAMAPLYSPDDNF